MKFKVGDTVIYKFTGISTVAKLAFLNKRFEIIGYITSSQIKLKCLEDGGEYYSKGNIIELDSYKFVLESDGNKTAIEFKIKQLEQRHKKFLEKKYPLYKNEDVIPF